MSKVLTPADMNPAFAEMFNSRDINNLLSLYEPGAVLKTDGSEKTLTGLREIAAELEGFLTVPGKMVSQNNFCIEFGEIALLRADWTLLGDDGAVIISGSSAEIVRKQPDGSWLYIVDHAAGAGLPRVN